MFEGGLRGFEGSSPLIYANAAFNNANMATGACSLQNGLHFRGIGRDTGGFYRARVSPHSKQNQPGYVLYLVILPSAH